MKIAILVGSASAGGAERVAISLANAFADRGHSLDLVFRRASGEIADRIGAGVRVVDLGAARALNAVRPFRRFLRSGRPDLVLAIGYEMNLVAALATIGLRSRPRLLLSVHGSMQRFSGAQFLWRVAAMGLSRLVYSRADRVVAVSQGVADELVAKGWVSPERIRVVHNPVVSDDVAERAAEDLPLGVPSNQDISTIVSVGRLEPQKNHALLLDAFRIVSDRRPAQLLIIGEGTCRADLQRRRERLGLHECVHFLGFVANPYPVMKAADVFVLSSDWEGFGNVLVEAMAVGTPVISTDSPHGPREILSDGEWGRLVPVRRPDMLADAILDVLEDGGIDGSRRAAEFSVAAAADKYLAIMSDQADV